MRPSFTHIALHTPDLEATIAFYHRYCGLRVAHDRGEGADRVVWLAEPGEAARFVFVLIGGAPDRPPQAEGDFSHLGFALPSRDAVDALAEAGRRAGCLAFAPREEPWPTGYYCALRDPSGALVEFSHGQPLGPGSEGLADDAHS